MVSLTTQRQADGQHQLPFKTLDDDLLDVHDGDVNRSIHCAALTREKYVMRKGMGEDFNPLATILVIAWSSNASRTADPTTLTASHCISISPYNRAVRLPHPTAITTLHC